MSHDTIKRLLKGLYLYNSAVTIYAATQAKDENTSAGFYFFGVSGLAAVIYDYYCDHLMECESEKPETQISGLGDFQNIVHEPPVLQGWDWRES